jgi:hypothetical protein
MLATTRAARFAACSAALAVLAAAARAGADEPRVELAWTAPEGCPDGARVVAEVERLLGPAGARPPRPIRAAAVVTRVGEGFVVKLETASDAGTRARELHGATCGGIGDAVALILALMIDPEHVVAPARGTLAAAESAPPPTPAAPPPAPPRSPAPQPAPSPPLTIVLSAAPVLDLGSVPAPAAGFAGAAGLVFGRARAEAGVVVLPARAATVASTPGAGGDVSLVAGTLAACAVALRGRTAELAPCAGFELGRLYASGFGVAQPGSGGALWSTAKLGALGVLRLGDGLALTLRLDAGAPFARPRFVLENVGAVFRSAPVVGRAAIGVETRF